MNFSLRIATAADAEQVTELGRETFYETWKDGYTEQDMDAYLSEAFRIELIRAELNDTSIKVVLAEVDGRLAGYGKLVENRFHASMGTQPFVELERLYLFREFHATGLAYRLMDDVLDLARSAGWEWIVLGVDVNNHRAIRFYTKYGFETFDKKIFRVGTIEDTDQLMKRRL
jgi:ribosomal protein S18 acetylase RimI-like enzyme